VSFYQYLDDVNVGEAIADALEGGMLDSEGIVEILMASRVMVIEVEEMGYSYLDLEKYIPDVTEQGIVDRVVME
jgi:hypothetical protein